MSTIISFLNLSLKSFSLASLLSLILPNSLIDSAQIELQPGRNQDPFIRARQTMIERDLVARGVLDTRVLEAMGSIPRERFVPEMLRVYAYEDRPLPIGDEQTISQPYIVAFMTELLGLKGSEKVLEIGTGSGYQTAVLGKLADTIFSIEILPTLSERAKMLLKELGFTNINLKVGDGFFGWEEHAPFDVVLVTAAAPKIPEPLWRQLREGGRLIMPLGQDGQTQQLVRVKKLDGKQIIERISGVVFVPLTGAIRQDRR
ncbi:MAG: protein-L-isoaspartate(D-aspartate) O-methyltransferase [Candidatus Binatia bacterium]|jgi:protein-L-isoaspartate(D-aspartate) O-methyltransferase